MTTFPDLRSLNLFTQETGGDSLTLPVGGHEYTWFAGRVTLRAHLRLEQARAQLDIITAKIAAKETVDPAADLLPGVDEDQFQVDLIGQDIIDQMTADGVELWELQHVGLTLLAWHLNGQEAARDMWLGKMPGGDAVPPAQGSASTKTVGSSTRKPPAKPRSAGPRSSRNGTSSKRPSSSTTRKT